MVLPGAIRFIPAYAGNSSSAHIPLDMTPVHPRLRGELSQSLLRAFLLLRFIPAYAGNSAFLSVLASVNAVHPRLRGELHPLFTSFLSLIGSSPLTRGTQDQTRLMKRSCRFIPAYAGNSNSSMGRMASHSVHPRLRGELNASPDFTTHAFGSSPLTRGTHD